jgi:hypothetical protein
MLEEARTNYLEVHSERLTTVKSNRAEIRFGSRKMECKQGFQESKIRLVLFISTLFYLSYIIHAPTLKNDTTLAPLHKSGRITNCQCFWKYVEGRVYKSWVPDRRGQYVSYGRRLILQLKYFNIKIRISSKARNINPDTRPKWKLYSVIVGSLYGICFTAHFWRLNFGGYSWDFGNFVYSCLDDRQF